MPTNQDTGRPPQEYLPLAPATFQILLALVDGERHGYAIMKEVATRSGGTVRLGPGTLYGALKRLLEAGLVEEGGERADLAHPVVHEGTRRSEADEGDEVAGGRIDEAERRWIMLAVRRF